MYISFLFHLIYRPFHIVLYYIKPLHWFIKSRLLYTHTPRDRRWTHTYESYMYFQAQYQSEYLFFMYFTFCMHVLIYIKAAKVNWKMWANECSVSLVYMYVCMFGNEKYVHTEIGFSFICHWENTFIHIGINERIFLSILCIFLCIYKCMTIHIHFCDEKIYTKFLFKRLRQLHRWKRYYL